jgi:hypothetical protein
MPLTRSSRWRPLLRAFALVGTVALLGASCSYLPQYVPPPANQPKPAKPPFAYEALGVRNSCFVESVNFYDEYLHGGRGGATPWARVLQWGNREGEFDIGTGHAVTVFVVQDKLWYYDINFGVAPLGVGVDRRADITDVAPKVFERYPQFRPILARYRDDFPQRAPAKPVEFLFYHANADIREATRVANKLGRYRPVSVLEFDLVENGQVQRSAGAAFVFGARLCLYLPRRGTHVSAALRGTLDDLRYLGASIKRVYPNATNIHWQPGGYLLFPPKEKT